MGDLVGVDFLLSAATRFVFHLKGNILPTRDEGNASELSLHVRNLFWICYIMDKEYSLRTGLAPNFEETHCDLTLPTPPETYKKDESFLFVALIRLAIIQSELYRRLYSVSALRQSDAELLGAIRDLDAAVENWKLSISINSRPTFTDRHTDAECIPATLFQLHYHHCMATIHQASGRCISWVQNQDIRGPGSSLAISVETSRSLLRKFLDSQLEFHRYNLTYVDVSNYVPD